MANPNHTKYEYLLERTMKNIKAVALSFGENRRITYDEMFDRIEKYASILYKKGIKKGDVIGVCLLNCPESVYLLYALDIVGAIIIGYSPLDNKEKIRRDLEITKPKMVITVDMNYSNFKNYEKALNFSTVLFSPLESIDNIKLKIGYKLLQIKNGNYSLDKRKKLKYIINSNIDKINDFVLPIHSYEFDELTDILFTGGSTGIHKGVLLPGTGLNYVVEGMDGVYKSNPGDVELGHIPFGHMAFGRMVLHYALCNSMNYHLTLKAFPKDFYDELVRTGAYGAVGGPPHWTSLIEKDGDRFVPKSNLKKGTLKNLHYATSGGEAIKSTMTDAINEALEYCGSTAKIGDGLGATETWATVILNDGIECSKGTLGKSISTIKVNLIDPKTGLEVAKGEKGLAYITGPSVMLGYLNQPEETNRVLSYDEKGTRKCNLGDFLQEVEESEYKYIGRLKRNFVCGVHNIYPEELESFLSSIPNVREAAVTAVPDDFLQYAPSYHISLYKMEENLEKITNDIKKLVEEHLGKSWLPIYIDFTDKPLVRMANTKIDLSFYEQQDKEKNECMSLKLVNRD